MPDPGTASPDHKSHSHRWREKLSRRDSKPSKENQARDEEDIQSFLHATKNGRAASTTPEVQTPPEFTLPANTHLLYNAASSQAKSKRPRKSNLSVTFSTAPPILIGEGGDDAMVPVAELLSTGSYSKLSVGVFKIAGSQDYRTPPPSTGSVYNVIEDELTRPPALQRRSTGLQDHDQCASTFSSEQEIVPKNTDRAPSEAYASFRNSLKKKALKEDPQLVRSVLAERDVLLDETLSEDQESQAHASNTLHLPQLDPATSFTNSLTPLPSPQPSQKHDSSTSLDASFAATRLGYDGNPTRRSSISPERVTQQPHQQISRDPVIERPGFSIRNVAKRLGDDAYHDFATRGK